MGETLYPDHDVVSPLPGGRALLVRHRGTGRLAVLRRVGMSSSAVARRLRALARAGDALVAPFAGGPGGTHLLRPFVPGRPLAEVLAAPPPPADALRLAAALAARVGALHARRVAHGALHPGNVIVTADGGIAIVDGVEPARLPLAPGDPGAALLAACAAPEVLRGGPASPEADAFSLAVLVHALLAGRVPLRTDDALETVRRVLFEEPARLAVVRPDLPASLDAAVARALEKRRWRRGGAAALARELGAVGACPVTAAPARELGAVVAPPVTAAPVPSPRPSPPLRGGGGGGEATSHSVRPERRGAQRPEVEGRPTATPTLATPFSARARAAATALAAQARALPSGAAARRVRRTTTAAARATADLLHPTVSRLRALPLPARATLVAIAVAAAALLVFRGSDPSYAREASALIAAGDLSRARAVLDVAAHRRPGDPLIEKLRGDLACARGDAAEGLRRYRAALEARPRLGSDPVLRENVLHLLARDTDRLALVRVAARVDAIDDALVERSRDDRYWVRWNAVRALEARGEADRIDYVLVYVKDLEHGSSCATKRAAASKLAELRDPRALPALEEARREGGLLGFFCTGDALDRAIAATRGVGGRG